jgi:hypothetical protein
MKPTPHGFYAINAMGRSMLFNVKYFEAAWKKNQ